MKLKYNFVLNEVAGEMIAVATGGDLDKFSGFLKMNKTGAFIFSLLKKEITFEEIVKKMEKEYSGVDTETLKRAAEEFLDYLKKADVI